MMLSALHLSMGFIAYTVLPMGLKLVTLCCSWRWSARHIEQDHVEHCSTASLNGNLGVGEGSHSDGGIIVGRTG